MKSVPSPSVSPRDPQADEFRVHAPVEIQALLRALFEQQTLVTLTSAAGASLNTRLCVLELEQGILGFDVLRQDPMVTALVGAEEISATSFLDQIRVVFELEGLMQVNGARGSVLRAAVPTVLHRFQRRQTFRVRPNTRTPQARLHLPHQAEATRLRIIDLSVGGLALLMPQAPAEAGSKAEAQEPQSPWPLGSELRAQVELDRDTHFSAQLRLQHFSNDPEAGSRLGFSWALIDLPAQRALQHFIDQAQKLSLMLRKT